MQTLTPELRSLLTQLSQQLQPEPDRNPPLLEIWDAWVETLDLSVETAADHYHVTRRQIVKAGNPLAADTEWFLGNALAPQTYNSRLRYLKSCAAWAVAEGLMNSNPWAKSNRAKNQRKLLNLSLQVKRPE